jgi:glutamine amidotransferase
MQVAIVKYNAGNIYSVVNALRRLGIEPTLTDDAELLKKADKVLFPGQGHAGEAMDYLRAHKLDEVIRDLKQPVFGICVGQQLLCKHSEEGDTECIGIFDTDVKRFQPQRHEEKVPCMGWNLLEVRGERSALPLGLSKKLEVRDYQVNPILKGLGENPYVYFVHSYYVPVCAETIATADYILPYSASMHKDNFYTCQFHPEKSGKVGERILKNFLDL